MPDQAKDQENKQQSKPKSKAKPKAKKQYWLRTCYIKGWGTAAMGEEVNKAQRAAWKKHTTAELSDYYIGDNPPVAPETDKEKLAAYDALKKE